jgi:DNA-binding MarR family transcriptional regulator
MHAVFFGLKRAHHSVLRISRSALTSMGLTAARFDLLYVVKKYRRGLHQCDLRRLLGVGRTTISRMLASLEELGLVKRTRTWSDRRTKLVELTPVGRKRIAFAHRRLVLSGWAQLALDSAMGVEKHSQHWCDPDACVMATSLIDGLLRTICAGFFDGAKPIYPWSPDDFDDPWEDVLEYDFEAS